MTRINLFRTMTTHTAPSTQNSMAWGKTNFAEASVDKTNFNPTTSTLIFAALLIVCSLTVGCSSDKSKSISSTNQSPIAQPISPITTGSMPAAATPTQATATPMHKKVVHKAPATSTYADNASGVSFQYPRKYALKTGDAADELVSSDPVPMDFVQPGGVALAAVALPESAYPHSDLVSAFFNVSVNKTLTADQCGEFSLPQPNPTAPADPTIQATAQPATPSISKPSVSKLPISKLVIGDMELQSSETNSGGESSNSPREESAKYYHVFQNGACYEFALKVATTAAQTVSTTESTTKPVNRDEVFQRLEKILATVKIDPIAAPEVNAEVKTSAQPAPATTSAQ
jgi:hypothetical protein